MASTFGFTSPVSTFDDIIPSQAHRARLSIHLNTPLVRRRLIVQIVTLPVGGGVDPLDGSPSPDPRKQPEAPPGIARLLDNYGLEQALRRWG